MSCGPIATLREWRKHVCGPDDAFVIWGYIYDDVLHRFPDGHFIHTGRVEKIDGGYAYTAKNIYKLEGAPVGPEFTTSREKSVK